MKHKKLVVMAMSILVVVGINYHVFASEEKNKTVINGSCELAEINVTVPTSGDIYLNPYKMPVEIDGESINDQIVSTPTIIQNKSEVPLSVDVTVTGTVNEGSNMILSSTSMQDIVTTAKKAFIYFEIKPTSTDDSSTAAWDSEFDPQKHIVVRTVSRFKKKMITLAADGEDGCYGAFRLTGDCVVSPRSSWTEADGISVEIAFTFHPLPIDTVI